MVEIINYTEEKINSVFLGKIVGAVLLGEKKPGMVSLVITTPQKIKKINKLYRKKNEPTDVLSFATHFKEFRGKFVQLGEIFICPKIIKKTAKTYKTNYQKEFSRALIHGTLHLLGYRHKKKKEKDLMKRREEKHLKKFFK